MTVSEPLANYARIISALHANWKAHAGQVTVGRALFRDGIRLIFVACGRKWGKTELILYILWRWAMTHPGQGCWYICPELKHARKIVWTDPRIKNFGPKEWIAKINHSEMRIELVNGSYIQIDGSDNFEAHRGTRPGIVVYEESKDHKPQFREIMRPNMSVYNAPEIHIGTPPSDDDTDEVQEYWDQLEVEFRASPEAFYYTAPSWENPHFDRAWGAKEKKRLADRGELHVWEREYGAKRVKGGKLRIFPMLAAKDIALTPHAVLMARLKRDRKKLEYLWWADPAGASCFGVLFAAINPFTKDVFWLDEIYEKDQGEMTVVKIGRRIIAARDEIYDDADAWRSGYDEAAAWFANEWLENFPNEPGLEPTRKSMKAKEDGLTQIKDTMLAGKWHMSDRCQKLYWEMNKYRLDDKGRIPKKDDHLIDDARYILAAANYELARVDEYVEADDDDFRGARIEDDFPERDDFSMSKADMEEFA